MKSECKVSGSPLSEQLSSSLTFGRNTACRCHQYWPPNTEDTYVWCFPPSLPWRSRKMNNHNRSHLKLVSRCSGYKWHLQLLKCREACMGEAKNQNSWWWDNHLPFVSRFCYLIGECRGEWFIFNVTSWTQWLKCLHWKWDFGKMFSFPENFNPTLN